MTLVKDEGKPNGPPIIDAADVFRWNGDLAAFTAWFGEPMPIDHRERISVPVYSSPTGMWKGLWLQVWCGSWIVRRDDDKGEGKRHYCFSNDEFQLFVLPHVGATVVPCADRDYHREQAEYFHDRNVELRAALQAIHDEAEFCRPDDAGPATTRIAALARAALSVAPRVEKRPDARDEANALGTALGKIANLAMPRATTVQREIHTIAIEALTAVVEGRVTVNNAPEEGKL